MTTRTRTSAFVALALAAATVVGSAVTAAPAGAQSAADLRTTMSAPATTPVGTAARYTVTVSNTGASASAAQLVVDLPRTNTSPTVHVMGDVANVSSGCVRSGTTLSCSLGSIARNRTRSVSFDLTLPYSTTPLNVGATASSATPERTPVDNVATRTAQQTFTSPVVAAPQAIRNTLCTGTGLTSFFECTLYPSSQQTHDVTFLPGGEIDLSAQGAGYGGSWTASGTDLTFTYTEDGVPVGTFVGKGTAESCWEGRMTFPGATAYSAMYQVCTI